MKIIKLIAFYLLGIVAILCVSVFPQYFSTRGMPDTSGYFGQLIQFFGEMANPNLWLYPVQGSKGEFPILEVLWEPFVYSMKILLGALGLGFFIAFCFAMAATFLPNRVLAPVKRILDFLESVPDLIFASLLQLLVILVLKTTGIHLFRVASYTEPVYLAPILTLAILPMVSMFKILLLMIEEEFLKVYVTFLKSKGIRRFGILMRHILKNIMPISFHHMKIIIWGTLSSQFIIERVFNVHGLTFYLLESFTPMTIAFTLILIFTPFYFFFQLMELWLKDESAVPLEIKSQRWGRWNLLQWKKDVKNGFAFSLKSIKIRKPSLFRPFTYFFQLLFSHMKNWKFALGLLFFVIAIGYSLIYSVTTDNHVDQVRLYYNEDGSKLLGTPPLAPTEPFFFGSDRLGFSLFDQLVIGAKYTLFFALLIALLRVFGGLLFGVLYAFHLRPRSQEWFGRMTDSIHFLPLSLIAYILLAPILMPTMQGFAYSFTERVLLEIFILTILVIPLTTVLLGKEIKQVLEYEFIISAKVLGGSKFHVFWRHVLPHLGPRLTILFGQQFIQVLLIFIHLGVFQFFFGGTILSFGMQADPPRSMTNEWSGLIGQIGQNAIAGGRYWFLWILVAFMLAIFAMQFIIQGVKEVQQVKVGVLYKLPKKRKIHDKNRETPYSMSNQVTKDRFRRIKHTQ
ncbi:peptide/nickel transport system permease protein [Mesobacillus persicus]|uniref:Peptide/nickel transport system permease protein n=1 Tax=Mesobacillus persicus TaxID=930146 RepID=A0A1H8L0A2_9BACI|nr:ABC transporter permease subunit [Mesobacillus persicus]SEN98565.1 peptide/nickel transport system permease protein [Mesobacillus persicus]